MITRGPAGEWDSVDVLNPSVVRHEGVLYNFYSGYDGRSWHTGLATSSDGITWRKAGKVLSPDNGGYIASNGSALYSRKEWLYWYHSGSRDRPVIGLARSRDGRVWTKAPAPVLEPGPRGSWDERGVADPYVIEAGDWYFLYYLGQDRARRQRLGVAQSRDGVTWEKLRKNPVLELGEPGAFDENGLGEAAVWPCGGEYCMLYTGRARDERRRLGLAISRDGVTWRKSDAVFEGAEPWNRMVICDPTVIVENGEVTVWFGGGDVAAPDENIHGQIGVARLIPKGKP
ncbi:MAG: hypothetical protein ACRD8O_19995 [Bryobacteraceae bacterium]